MKNKKSDKKDKREKNAGNETVNNPAAIYGDAVRNAVNACIAKHGIWRGLLRRIDLWRKPRLIIGGEGSGKTSLALNSGLPYDFIYSNARLTNGNEAPQCFFSEKAVYIDTPGELSDPQEWAGFCRALKKHKFPRRRAVDGMLICIDAGELLAMDQTRVNKFAAALRERADILVSITGYEIPVYFIFNKSDKLEGFGALFSDKNVLERMPAVGTLVGDSESGRREAEVFLSHYRKTCDEVSDLCLQKLTNIDGVEKSGQLCSFMSKMVLAETRISAFITEFFNTRGQSAPRFRGFFFTSSKAGAAALSGHILGEAIPNAKFRIREAGTGTLGHWVKKICLNLLLAVICLTVIFYFAGSGLRDAKYMRGLEYELTALLGGEPTLENQFMALEKLRLSYNHLHGKFKSPGRLIFRTNKVRSKIKDVYITASEQIIINPAAKYLETSITRQGQGRAGELAGEEHQTLYHSLKTYLLLTSGNQVKIENTAPIVKIVEQSLKNSLGPRYGMLDEKIVGGNISAVIKFAADGFYGERADQRVVQTARVRLTAAPCAATVYGAVINRLHAQRRPVPINQLTGQNEILRFGHTISALYTREGWEQTVFVELVNASKDPYRADWVIGPVTAEVDEAKFLTDLVLRYTDDLSRRWLDFLRNTSVSLPSDISALAHRLERLSARESEVGRMLTVVCSLAMQEPAAPQSEAPAGAAAALKGQIAGVSNRIRGNAANIVYDVPDPFVETRKTFGAVQTFLTDGGFDGYLKNLGVLSEKIKNCDARGGFTQTFAAAGGDDPLRTCRNDLNRAYQSMPSVVSASLKRVLESPLDITAAMLARRVSTELEESWQAEVINPFNEKLAGRYPLDRNGSDLAWNDFEEFFKPQSGALWRYFDGNLAGFIERTHRGYEKRPRRSLSIIISINDEVINTYSRAERIASGFFGNDGAPRRQEIAFYPFTSSSGDVRFFVGDRQFDFQGGLPVTLSRRQGSAGDETIILRLTASDRVQEELLFRGEWGIMRLFNAGRIDRQGSDRYRISWRLNVRNIYTANVTTVVRSNSEALFNESITRGFTVPKKVLY
ncbi:MAG: hypothetical protein LBC70_03740 [Chitinispirillales bacterium]|nr:hypothetical protein [Chitinispirillales bacterium]